MKRTALAVLGIALLLISFTACNPSSNNGPIVLPDKNPDKNPPSQEQTAQDIADALNIPQLLHDLLINKSGAYDVTYTYSDDIPTSQLATSAGPTEDKDAIIATVTFNQDHELNGVTISSGGKIIYTIIGRNTTNSFTSSADDACTIKTENLKVNGQDITFTANATIEMTATISGTTVSNEKISSITMQSVSNATIGGDTVDITVPTVDPSEPGGDDNEESQQPGTDNEGTDDTEEVTP